ncbi:MAG: DUF2799 domain-containing protein [Pseudomonadota bacterium]
MKTVWRSTLVTVLTPLLLIGCETISEDACLAGSWEDVGFSDGERGASRSRLADIAEECVKYGVAPDRAAYLRGLELGLERFCVPRNGFNSGRSGASPNAECVAGNYLSYLDAHADGYDIHLTEEERDRLIDRWQDRRKAYDNVEGRLLDTEMDAKERRRLERKSDRLSREMDDLRIDIRAMEQLNGLDRWSPPD